MALRFAIDTGGTFTDLIVEDEGGNISLYKSLTTPDNPTEGVINVLKLAAEQNDHSLRKYLGRGDVLVYGTTTATNAVVTGRIARTAFLTTAGHPDILVLREGGRIGLPLFDFSIPYPDPYIPRDLTFEIEERITMDGEVSKPLAEWRVHEVASTLERESIEAVAVCFLWSIANPVHEQRAGEILHERLPEVPVSLSHQVNPSLREYRRASATAIDASLKPVMSYYLNQLEERLRDEGFSGRALVVTSQGAMKDLSQVAAAPIHTVKSGPAMAPVAGRYYAAKSVGTRAAIVADTGGTTYDIALVRDGRIPETRETWIGRPFVGHMTGFPSVDIRSVGAGGGSIAWVDEGGLLRVGPESAGAVPGPVCYGKGGERPTATDAALLLGYIDPDYFLGGRMRLDVDKAEKEMSRRVAKPLGIDVEAASLAVLALLTETMAGAIEDLTVNQGIDPRTACLIGGGGAAGLNSTAIARRLECPQVVFPDVGAVLSAAGGLLCPVSEDLSQLCLTSSVDFDFDSANEAIDSLIRRAESFIAKVKGAKSTSVAFSVEARYAQQIWEIKLPLPVSRFEGTNDLERVCEAFHRLHREIFAFEDPDAEIEFVTWRALVSCELRDRELGRFHESCDHEAVMGRRDVVFPGGRRCSTPVYRFESMVERDRYKGPAIVETPFTTIVIDSGSAFAQAASGALVVDIELPVHEVRNDG
ncbi:MAG: hydantoinase/oxoprolinase family protein [Arenicellales bacterium]